MNADLPPVIDAFFRASNARDFTDFLLLSTADARVNDEANDHYGREILTWIDEVTADTKPFADVMLAAQRLNLEDNTKIIICKRKFHINELTPIILLF